MTRLPLTPSPVALAGLVTFLFAVGCGSDGLPTAEKSTSTGGSTMASEKNPGGGGASASDASSSSGGSANPQSGDQTGQPSPPAPAADAGAAMDASLGPAKDAAAADAGDTGASDTGAAADGGDAKDAAPLCNTTDPVSLYLSADDSNSMASATVARGLIQQGQYAYKPIRPWEFLNYYAFDYPAAAPDEVTVTAQLRAEPGDGAYRLQVGVRAPDFSEATRRRFQIVLTVDTSSSMGWGALGDTGIDRARAACVGLVSALGKGDTFSLVRWGKKVEVAVDGKLMAGADDGTLAAACLALQPDGDSPLSAGLQKAYALATQHFDGKAINRVILVSDGGANVGEQDAALIAKAAQNADGKDDGSGIYLMGAGVGDPWNYNDKLMNTVTDAGKGAYVFLDTQKEAGELFAKALLRHLEVAARNVQVQVILPPTFAVEKFYGEQISTKKEEVEPQHLAANDAMIFHQTIQSCNPKALTGNEKISVIATWQHPQSNKAMTTTWTTTLGALLSGPHALLDKGAAVVAFTDALQATQQLDGAQAIAQLDKAAAAVQAAQQSLSQGAKQDPDLVEIADLLAAYKQTFAAGQQSQAQTKSSGADPITKPCTCAQSGGDLAAMACALDLCDPGVVLGQTLSSPTGSKTEGAFAAVSHFGAANNHLTPQQGGSYALLATGPALGTEHSQDLGGQSMPDPYSKGGSGTFNAVEWRLHLKAPAGANGIRFRHVFFSEEYDDYVGSSFNDKFYAVIEAGSTNGGTPTVINYTDCRDPQKYYDFVCSPGMQFCDPRARYCYIAINTALSECCWLGGCPNGKAKTSIAGTGFECAASQGSDGPNKGSSTGWLMTEWPVEPGEDFYLTFHVHDTGDGIFDSEVILDGLQFVAKVNPGTFVIPPM